MALKRKTEGPVRARLKGDQTYLDAERDFVYHGMEVTDIAKKYDVPRNTVAQWHYVHDWISLRLKHNKEINNRLFEETAQQSCEILQEGFAIVKETLIPIHEALVHLNSKKSESDKQPVILKYISAYKELIRLAQTVASVYSAIKPDISQDQGEKLLASLQKVKEEIKTEEEKK